MSGLYQKSVITGWLQNGEMMVKHRDVFMRERIEEIACQVENTVSRQM